MKWALGLRRFLAQVHISGTETDTLAQSEGTDTGSVCGWRGRWVLVGVAGAQALPRWRWWSPLPIHPAPSTPGHNRASLPTFPSRTSTTELEKDIHNILEGHPSSTIVEQILLEFQSASNAIHRIPSRSIHAVHISF